MSISKINNTVSVIKLPPTDIFGYAKLKTFLRSLFFSFLIPIELIAQNDSTFMRLEMEIIDKYNLLLAGKVTSDLHVNHEEYLKSPNKYWNFLNDIFLGNWDFDVTTRALIGSEIFNSLSDLQFKELSRVLEVTLIRYAFESLSFYGGQKLNVIDIRLNKQQSLAWLKINIDSTRFPDIHLDLLLKRNLHDQWRGVDFRFKGITYVNLKKSSYRQDFEDIKFKGLLRKLNDKNKLFFNNLCQSKANYINPEVPPCL